MSELTLITGGSRSGKSGFAEAKALAAADRLGIGPVAYLATGEAYDQEFSRRIAHHQASRDQRFVTVEESLDLESGLRRAWEQSPIVLLECITTWLGNVFLHRPEDEREAFARAQIDGLFRALDEQKTGHLFVVTNEIGMGVVPMGEFTRHYCDAHGRTNQRLAHASTGAWLLVSGLPVSLK